MYGRIIIGFRGVRSDDSVVLIGTAISDDLTANSSTNQRAWRGRNLAECHYTLIMMTISRIGAAASGRFDRSKAVRANGWKLLPNQGADMELSAGNNLALSITDCRHQCKLLDQISLNQTCQTCPPLPFRGDHFAKVILVTYANILIMNF